MYSIYIYFLFLHERTFIFISLFVKRKVLNNCFDWILWRYINKNYYYIIIIKFIYRWFLYVHVYIVLDGSYTFISTLF